MINKIPPMFWINAVAVVFGVYIMYDIVMSRNVYLYILMGMVYLCIFTTFYSVKLYGVKYPDKFAPLLAELGKINAKLLIALFFAMMFVWFFSFVRVLVIVLIVLISSIVVTLMSFKKFSSQKFNKDDNLDRKIKAFLNLKSVKTHKKNFPKKLSWIGGFVTPLYPFFVMVNKGWAKKNLTKEAVIHEHVHLHLLIYEGWAVFFILYIMFINPVSIRIMPWVRLNDLLFFILLALLLVLHEKATFIRTQEVAKNFKIKTRSWSGKLSRRYFRIYFLWFLFVRLFVEGLIALIMFGIVGVTWVIYLW